jgi:2'-5' RNA ligase
MSDERWRLFVAVPIGEDLRQSLRNPVEEWRNADELAGLRWMEPAAWHVTLAFLGSTDASSVPALLERLASVAGTRAATISRTGGLGAFPTPAHARVVWYGVEDIDGRMGRLAAEIAVALDVEASRPLRPHLTLARVRRQPVDLRHWLAAASAPEGDLIADRIELMRSHLGGGPARYETLATMKLGVPAGV